LRAVEQADAELDREDHAARVKPGPDELANEAEAAESRGGGMLG
jgi:hypothetical protein